MVNDILTGQICCGFVKDMILGSASAVDPPCTPTIVDVITGGTFDNPADWTFNGAGGVGQIGNISGGSLNWLASGEIGDGWFQSIPALDPTKTYTLSLNKTADGFGDPNPFVGIMLYSPSGFGAFHSFSNEIGNYSYVINANAPEWTAGDANILDRLWIRGWRLWNYYYY